MHTLVQDAVGKQVRLIWRGKVLNDDKKLSDYGTYIADLAVIISVYRVARLAVMSLCNFSLINAHHCSE